VHDCDVSIIRADRSLLRATVTEGQADKLNKLRWCVLAELK
jgi:hypothetical protein